jgi:CheY-like chemotaxis protein
MPNESRGRRILVVDDNVDLAIAMALILRICGHDPATAFNRRDAVQAARATRPDIILMDLELPDGDGCELARTLRRELGHEEPRIIAISAFEPMMTSARRLDCPFDEHLVKPVDMERLLQLLEVPTR